MTIWGEKPKHKPFRNNNYKSEIQELAKETIRRETKLSLLSETNMGTGGKGSKEAYICGNQKVVILKGKAGNLKPHFPRTFVEYANRRERIGVIMEAGMKMEKISPCCS